MSVGEVIQLQKIVSRFLSATGDHFHVVVTTSTDTGFDLAQERFDGCQVEWCPLDFSWSVSAAVRRIRPELLVLMELEIWPNLLNECQRKGVRTAIVNARMSERSFRGYQRVQRYLGPILEKLDCVMAQSKDATERLIQLGVQRNRMTVTGSIKFDGVQSNQKE